MPRSLFHPVLSRPPENSSSMSISRIITSIHLPTTRLAEARLYRLPMIKPTYTIGFEPPSLMLNYVVMSNAAEALVEVILINGDKGDPADVYGKIYSHDTSSDNEIELFGRSKSDPVEVSPNHPIPLLRSAVAVPLNASLKISAHL